MMPDTEANRLTRAYIHLERLAHNLRLLQEQAGAVPLWPVIKANAYGHGVLTAASYLDGADAFAVAMPAEGVALRRGGVTKPLVVLQGFANNDELGLCAEHDLQPVVHQPWQADMLYTASRFALAFEAQHEFPDGDRTRSSLLQSLTYTIRPNLAFDIGVEQHGLQAGDFRWIFRGGLTYNFGYLWKR